MNNRNLALMIMTVFISITCAAQFKISPEAISVKTVEKYALSFDLNDKTSKGYQFLESLVANNNYLVIGEYHFSENIQLLSTEICDLGSKYGYSDFICETGRYSMQFLNKIVKENEDVEQALTTYFKPNKFKMKHGDETEILNPIAFLTTKQEVPLLKKLKEKNYSVYGIDQEFLSSTKMFVNELMKRKPLQKEKRNELYYHLDSLQKRYGESDFNYYKSLLADSLIVSYLSSYKEENWQNIFNTWRESIEIYCARRSNLRRINLMRRNFVEQISSKLDQDSDFKFIVKLGAVHTSRGIGDLGLYDIGDLVSETAKQYKKKALHIRCGNRFFEEMDDVYDSCEKEDVLEKLGQKDKWVIIDLKSLRQAYHKNEFYIPENLVNTNIKSTIENNDIFIITPTDRELIEL